MGDNTCFSIYWLPDRAWKARMRRQHRGRANSSAIRWLQGELRGRAAYGEMYPRINRVNGELMAMEEIQTEAISRLKRRSCTVRPTCKKTLSHPHICRYQSSQALGSSPYVVSSMSIICTERFSQLNFLFIEYAPGCSIASILSRFGPFDESPTADFSCHVFSGLEFLAFQRHCA